MLEQLEHLSDSLKMSTPSCNEVQLANVLKELIKIVADIAKNQKSNP